MTRGMYAAAGGMLIGLRAGDVHANNLANTSTPGFRSDHVSFAALAKLALKDVKALDGQPATIVPSSTLNPSVLNLSQAPLNQTDNPLDLAVDGDGWFVVDTPAGERYTRNGHFTLAADGTLTTVDGHPVLTDSGPVKLAQGEKLRIRDGRTLVGDGGRELGRLRLVRFGDPGGIVKQGANLVSGGAPVADETTREVRQGMLEGSNSETMRVMVDMMANLRFIEMNQRVIQAQDASLGQAIEIARR